MKKGERARRDGASRQVLDCSNSSPPAVICLLSAKKKVFEERERERERERDPLVSFCSRPRILAVDHPLLREMNGVSFPISITMCRGRMKDEVGGDSQIDNKKSE